MAPDLLASALRGPELRGFSAVLAGARASPLEQLLLLPSPQRAMSVQSPLHNWGNGASVQLTPKRLST